MPRGKSRGHPKLLQRTVRAIAKKLGGATPENMQKAFAIATASLQRAGHLKQGTQKLSKKGKKQSRRHYGKGTEEYESMLQKARKQRQTAEGIIAALGDLILTETQH